MRFAYADPPYPGNAHRYPENEEVDHRMTVPEQEAQPESQPQHDHERDDVAAILQCLACNKEVGQLVAEAEANLNRGMKLVSETHHVGWE